MYTASRQPSFGLLVLAAWLVVVLQLVVQYWPETALTLNDTDDAMRLVQLRAFLAGQGWFDLHETRVQPPGGYDPHWSRLIDAGLAALYLLFRAFADAEHAERLMRVVWPLLWLLPAIAGVSAIAWRMAGREAALVVLLFVAIGFPAFMQFKPGRIDHHNVQIAIALLTVAATTWSDRLPWCASAAGVLTGLGLVVGFEGMPFLVLCGAVLAFRYVVDAEAGGALRAYGLAVAASMAAGFALNVAPSSWAQSACDSLAINSTAAVVTGGLGLVLASLTAAAHTTSRLTLIGSVALVTGLTFAAAQPRCLLGPYAMVDPAVRSLWLVNVQEMQPLLSVFAADPLTGLGNAVFPAAAVIAVVMLALRGELGRDFGTIVASTSLLLGIAMMLIAIKGNAYTLWLAMPLVAVMALRLFALLRLTSLVPRFIASLLLTPMVLSTGAITIAEAAGITVTNQSSRLTQKACFRNNSYAPFAEVPPGLVVADIDYGPFLLALTPHSVLAAPYHRLSAGIIDTHRIFASPPDEARRIAARVGASYLAVCGSRVSPAQDADRATSLLGLLQSGAVPDWLAPVPGPTDQPFRIYRVRS